jgi:hypothetical protein
MKRTIAALGTVAILTLAACGGVDKQATADLLIKDLKEAGQTFTPEQETCVKDAVKSYSEEELKQLSEDKASDELSTEFITKFAACMS